MSDFNTRYIDEYEDVLHLHLASTTAWSDGELDRAIEHAIHDISRFVPREKVIEYRIDNDEIAAEAVTLASGTKTVTYKPVKWNSVSVTDTDGNACVRGTDYEFDFMSGTITRISGGEIASDTEVIAVTYTRDPLLVDISALTSRIRVHRVEYPVGNVPQYFATFEEFGDFLTITKHPNSKDNDQQQQLNNDQHVRLYYHDFHTMPGASSVGSLPVFYDEIIVKGAEAYCWLIAAGQHEILAAADFASARTELGLTTAVHVSLATALAAIATEAAAANAALDAIDVSAATTAAAASTTTLAIVASDNIHAGAETALDAAATQLGLITARIGTGTLPNMFDYLATGDDLIPTVNVGEDVAPNYAAYAQMAGQLGSKYAEQAMVYVQEATARLQKAAMLVAEAQAEVTVANSYSAAHANEIRTAEGYIGTANGYARQAEGLIGEINAHLQEADRFTMVGMQSLELAGTYREMGIDRRNEFWMILSDRHQRGADKHSTQRV